jgi:murein L,D-transpeptidase YcbB/YkuD
MQKEQSGIKGAWFAKAFTPRSLVMAAGIAFAVTASGARSQTTDAAWWETLFDPPGGSKRRQGTGPRESAPEVIADLRPGATPWRSDAMLNAMEAAVARYHRIVFQGGWPAVPADRLLRPGDEDQRVPYLRHRLIIAGDLRSRGPRYDGSYTFDAALAEGVMRFQQRHGLRLTGRVDQPTLAQMNVSADARLEQLKLNQRRIRELMEGRIEDRYVLVNVAAFQLEAVEGHAVQLRHRVIVGKPERPTPSVKATIRAINFFPYWRVPESVANLDLIPRLQREPDYLRNEQIRVFLGPSGAEMDPANIDWHQVEATKVKFRQDPGPQNALGLVRIDMPNEHMVYMHDTPMKPLFSQRGRAFSAGCVRVEDVFTLVEWIARYEPGWEQPGRTQDVIAASQPVDVNLTKSPVPVYFTYVTAWAEADGRVEFRPDVYGRDGSRDYVGERDPDAPPPPQMLAP